MEVMREGRGERGTKERNTKLFMLTSEKRTQPATGRVRKDRDVWAEKG